MIWEANAAGWRFRMKAAIRHAAEVLPFLPDQAAEPSWRDAQRGRRRIVVGLPLNMDG